MTMRASTATTPTRDSTTTPTRDWRPETDAPTAGVHHGPEAKTIGDWIDRSLPSSCHAVRIVHADQPTMERSWMQVHRGARKRAALLDRLGGRPGAPGRGAG